MSTLRQALRSLANTPGFTLVALLTLALGIGANTAMFSLVNTLLFKSAPYPRSEQLVRLRRTSSQSQTWPLSLPDLQDIRDTSRSFSSLTPFQWHAYNLTETGGPAVRLSGMMASADLFATLGIQPMIGRGFTRDEQQPGADRVVVLSYEFWQDHFGGDRDVIGKTIRLDSETNIIIGVFPERFSYPMLWGRVDIWKPLALIPDWRQDRSEHWLNAVARLKPGITIEQAGAELDGVANQLARQYPATNAGSGLSLEPLHRSATNATQRNLSWLALALSGFVLLIACANLANLQLARTAVRAREFAIRAALGASRWRLMKQLLVESVLLSVIGGNAGLLLALWINQALGHELRFGPSFTIPLDTSVLLFAALASVSTGILFGTMPAWIVAKADPNNAIKSQARGSTGDRSQHHLRQGLVVAEVALSLVLLSGAGFFIRGLQRFMERDPGWDTSSLLTATISLPQARYNYRETRGFHELLEQRLATLPGVDHAALATSIPIVDWGSPDPIFVEGQPMPKPGEEPKAFQAMVTPSFFPTLRISLVAGRMFPKRVDPNGPNIALINESLARQLFPNESPLGHRIAAVGDPNYRWEIVGVVRDVGLAAYGSTTEKRMQIYRPLAQNPWSWTTIVLRSSVPESLAGPLRQLVAELDADVPVAGIRTVRQTIDSYQHNFYVINGVLGGFALLGLALCAVGIYGVLAGLVVQRLPEFGIRLALGASPQNVLRLVLGQGLRLALFGSLLGLGGSMALVRYLASVVPGLPGQDYLSFAFNVVVIFAVAALACWEPARRATKADPMTALRAE
ncbi:MAG TPA: ABC transporter permease [Opitutus sp.]|nr:ABC transporter permease [Opitutus sp.]